MSLSLCLFLLLPATIDCSGPEVFVVVSQTGAFHQGLANVTQERIRNQYRSLSLPQPDIFLSSSLLPPHDSSAWAVFPLLAPFTELLKHYPDIQWVIIIDENTDFLVNRFLALQKLLSPDSAVFLGTAIPWLSLTASGPTNTQVPHPDLEEAIIFSRAALLATEGLLDRQYEFLGRKLGRSHEVNMIDSGALEEVMHSEGVQFQELGKVWAGGPVSSRRPWPTCGQVDLSNILFGVKTCYKHHHTRVPAIRNTWARLTKNIEFYSDVEDSQASILRLAGTTEPQLQHSNVFGCNKTFAILERFLTTSLDWLVLVDDDTMLSVSRLQQLLACYRDQEHLILGLRAGTLSLSGEGFTFPAGGAGTVLSRATVRTFVDSCLCVDHDLAVVDLEGEAVKNTEKLDGNEDLMLGVCAKMRAGLPVTNSFRLFQEAATDLDPDWLRSKRPISFHHHGKAKGDFEEVYKQIFGEGDEESRTKKGEL